MMIYDRYLVARSSRTNKLSLNSQVWHNDDCTGRHYRWYLEGEFETHDEINVFLQDKYKDEKVIDFLTVEKEIIAHNNDF